MPGPAPVCRPQFSEEFLEQARRAVRRRTLAHQFVQRFQLVLLLHQLPGIGHEEAGQRVGLSGRQVRRWRQRWAGGEHSVADEEGRGCKAGFSPAGAGAAQSPGLRERLSHPTAL